MLSTAAFGRSDETV